MQRDKKTGGGFCQSNFDEGELQQMWLKESQSCIVANIAYVDNKFPVPI